jgi:cell division septum initiation protein DivIVA
MKTQITNKRNEIATQRKELRTVSAKLNILVNKFRGMKTNYPYAVNVSILKRSRETYGKRGYKKLWNRAEGVNNYIYEDGIVYYDKATVSFGQDLWLDLDDSIKEVLKDCITTDKYETQNNMRAVLDEVYNEKRGREIMRLTAEQKELREKISNLEKELSHLLSIEESLILRNDKEITRGLPKKVSLDFEKEKRSSLITKVKREPLITKAQKHKKEEVHEAVIEILNIEKSEILEDYYMSNKSFSKIADELNRLYKKQLDKYEREVSYFDKTLNKRVTKVLPPRVRMTHIRKLIEKESKRTTANSASYRRDTRLSA